MLDCFNDVLVVRAATEIAFQSAVNFFPGGMRISAKELLRRNNHSWCAEAALQSVLLPKAFLQRVKLAVTRQSFDCRHFRAVTLDGEKCPRLPSTPLQNNLPPSPNTPLAPHAGTGH